MRHSWSASKIQIAKVWIRWSWSCRSQSYLRKCGCWATAPGQKVSWCAQCSRATGQLEPGYWTGSSAQISLPLWIQASCKFSAISMPQFLLFKSRKWGCHVCKPVSTWTTSPTLQFLNLTRFLNCFISGSSWRLPVKGRPQLAPSHTGDTWLDFRRAYRLSATYLVCCWPIRSKK